LQYEGLLKTPIISEGVIKFINFFVPKQTLIIYPFPYCILFIRACICIVCVQKARDSKWMEKTTQRRGGLG